MVIKRFVNMGRSKMPTNSSYTFLWSMLCLVFVFMFLSGVVFITKFGNVKIHAAANAACNFSPGSVNVGDSITVYSNRGYVSGAITIQGAYLSTAIPVGTLAKMGRSRVIIPPVAPGLYVVRVGTPAVTCKTITGADLAIQNGVVLPPSSSPEPFPACVLNVDSANPGGSVKVTSIGGLFGPIGMMGTNSSLVYSALGSLAANSSTTITVPDNTQAGIYAVRVGAFAISCTPKLSVGAVQSPTPTPLAATCNVSPSNINAGGTITVYGKDFTGLTYSAELISALSPNQLFQMGPFNGITGTYNIPPTLSPGAYHIAISGTGGNIIMCAPDAVIIN